jgi:hypothetical protein
MVNRLRKAGYRRKQQKFAMSQKEQLDYQMKDLLNKLCLFCSQPENSLQQKLESYRTANKAAARLIRIHNRQSIIRYREDYFEHYFMLFVWHLMINKKPHQQQMYRLLYPLLPWQIKLKLKLKKLFVWQKA